MRLALAQLNYTIGDFEKNVGLIREHISKAKKEKVDLIIFSELCISAYPPRDFLEFEDFIQKCYTAAKEIAKDCIGISAIIGLPVKNNKIEGKNLFNAALLLEDGEIVSEIHKALLPNYDIFDEYRYFEPGKNFNCIQVNGIKIALTICEDLWNIEDDPMYIDCPMDTLIKEHPKLMINIAASPFDYSHAELRKAILKRNTLKYNLPLIYVNHVGAQTELIFDGGSLAMDNSGKLICEMNYFKEDFQVMEYNHETEKLLVTENKFAPTSSIEAIERIHDGLIIGIRDYFQKSNFKKAILGLSGGIDSALVTYLAAEALGKENVHTILMPSEYSSSGSIDDSIDLINKLGVTHDIIPIKNLLEQYLNALKPFFKELPFNVTEENLQARIRGTLLMAESNKFGYILLNTSNKSELAVGYGTLYGDMCGGLSVIGDLYKTQVYDLCRFINRNGTKIPENILTKAPSAELRPNQKDSDSLPDYDILDKVLYNYIEKRKGPTELIAMGFEENLVKRILKLVNTNEYKRHQTPPILRVSPKAFGQGRRLPIVGKYLS